MQSERRVVLGLSEFTQDSDFRVRPFCRANLSSSIFGEEQKTKNTIMMAYMSRMDIKYRASRVSNPHALPVFY